MDLNLPWYVCIPIAVMGRPGCGITLWVWLRRGRTKHDGHCMLLHRRHTLVVIVSTIMGPLGLVATHMPQRTETDAYEWVTPTSGMPSTESDS